MDIDNTIINPEPDMTPKPEERDKQIKIPIQQRIGEFLFDHYKAFITIIVILSLVIVMATIPSTITYIIAFLVFALPKGMIFAVILQIFVGSIYDTGSYSNKHSWFKAIIIGILFSLTSLGGAMFGRYNWMSITIIFLVIIPLMIFYDLEFKKTLPIIILSIILSFAYDAAVAATLLKAVSGLG